MSLLNKEVLDLYETLGAHEVMEHLIESSVVACHGVNKESLRRKILILRRKHDSLRKSSSRPTGKAALTEFYEFNFHFPTPKSDACQFSLAIIDGQIDRYIYRWVDR